MSIHNTKSQVAAEPANGPGTSDDGASQDLLYHVEDHIARITLNRPHRANALTRAMHLRMRDIWADVRDNADIRCVIITGSGPKHFCTGTDVTDVAASGKVNAGRGPLSEEIFWSPLHSRVWKPVVCAVNGLAIGGGLHFVVDADIVVAADTASFADSHVNVGLVGAVENIGLSKRLPIGTALRMTLQGKNFRLPAQRAYALGLVDEMVAPSDLLATAEQIARDIAANSPAAVTLSKQSVWAGQEMGYRDAVEYGWALARMHWSHPDFVEGPRAFTEKRPPHWTV
jgi:E-phenylitaconyl-CoA hydratase